MSIDYQHVRALPLPLVADAAPNVVEPGTLAVFRLEARPPAGGQNINTLSHSVYVAFLDGAGALLSGGTLAFQGWERDARRCWVAFGAPQTLASLTKLNGSGVQGSDVFLQVTAVSAPVGAASVEVRVTEQGTEADAGYGADNVLGTVTADQGNPNTLANGWPVKITDGTNVLGTIANPLVVDDTDTPSTGATVTDVPASAVPVVLLAANPLRLSVTIFNGSNRPLTLKAGLGVTATSRTVVLPPQMEWFPDVRYTGVLTGFWPVGATGSAAVTEYTP